MSASGDRLRRFLRLERPRKDGPDGEERPSAAGRFEGVEAEPQRRPPPGVPASSRDRFAPPRERAPDVAQPSEEEQPFTRCLRCETDNSRFARACTNCGEDLRTGAQRAFNARLWARRKEERAELERENAELRAARAESEAETARLRRQAAEEMARQVGRRERARLGGGGGDWGDPWAGRPPSDADGPSAGPGESSPVGIRLLRLIRSPLWRLAAIGGIVLLAVVGFALARRSPLLLVVVVSVLVGLFTPRGRWRRRRWW